MATRTQTSGISGRSKTNNVDNAKFSRVHSIGVGSGASSYLINECAKAVSIFIISLLILNFREIK